jgi:hypothetical protein
MKHFSKQTSIDCRNQSVESDSFRVNDGGRFLRRRYDGTAGRSSGKRAIPAYLA